MIFSTIITKSHLAHARTWSRSILKHHPDAIIYVAIADQIDGFFEPSEEPFRTIKFSDFRHNALLQHMAFYYTPFELCCAARPFLHEYLWDHAPEAAWLFLDADTYILGDMTRAFEPLAEASVLLNPHIMQPPRPEFSKTVERDGLCNGVFNAGFLGMRRCTTARDFLNWFLDRMARYCFAGVPGLFVDQAWLTHVPYYFRDVKLYTHPGANVGHWNLFARNIVPADDSPNRYVVDGYPLQFLHFSGWDIEHPQTVSKYAPAYNSLDLPQVSVWKSIATQYREALLANGYADCCQMPYAFATFDDGSIIDLQQRRKYYNFFWSGGSAKALPSPFADRRLFAD